MAGVKKDCFAYFERNGNLYCRALRTVCCKTENCKFYKKVVEYCKTCKIQDETYCENCAVKPRKIWELQLL